MAIGERTEVVGSEVLGILEPEDRARVDAAVEFINGRAVRADLDLACVVGRYVIDEFFDGDYACFNETRRDEPSSFASLMEREDLLVPPTTVYTFVRVSRQIDELPSQVGKNLSLSHHRALLPLSDTATKVEIAREAVRKGWSKAKLERAAREHVSRSPQGLKGLPSWAEASSEPALFLEQASEEETSADEVGRLEERVQELLRAIDASRIRIERLHARLGDALDRNAIGPGR